MEALTPPEEGEEMDEAEPPHPKVSIRWTK